MVTILVLVKPYTADWLSLEDGIVENFSVVFLFLATIGFLYSFFLLRKKDTHRAVLILVILFATVCFVIGMEEISWMQRVFDIKSPEFFLENNRQQEFNVHNLSTILFENIYYIGAFFLFGIIPFYSRKVINFFENNRFLSNFTVLLPDTWMFLAFASTTGLLKGAVHSQPLVTLTAVIASIMTAHLVVRNTNLSFEKILEKQLTLLSLLALIFSAITLHYFDYLNTGVRTHVGSEYRELYIALAIFLWSMSIINHLFEAKKEQLHNSTSSNNRRVTSKGVL